MSQAAADTLVRAGDALFRNERFAEAAAQFEQAVSLLPHHALGWRGLGHALLCMGKPHDAARAFDRAIGLRPDSATALWGGALAHAEIGNKLIAKNYLGRTIALQPSWLTMALETPQLASFLLVSSRASDRLRALFGSLEKQRFHHTNDPAETVEVGHVANVPAPGLYTSVTIGLSNNEWREPERPRVELALAASSAEVGPEILANLAFHLATTKFFPEPGTIVRDVVAALELGELSARLPHVYIQSPRAWGIELPIDHGPPAITLAQVTPISEDEYQCWRRDGREALDAMLAAIDVADLAR